MGLMLDTLKQPHMGYMQWGGTEATYSKMKRRRSSNKEILRKFPDLNAIPPELALCVLSNLNATDLCLAACVWGTLANDDRLWRTLCKSGWRYASLYKNPEYWTELSGQQLYLRLDEATLTFNADPFMGMEYMLRHGIIEDQPEEIAKFFHHTNRLDMDQMRTYLESRYDVLEEVIHLQDFSDKFLPNALRQFFIVIRAPNYHDPTLARLLDQFSEKFCRCNPHSKLTPDIVVILCYSLILLSVDLWSPQVKNKMSKREFIRNVRQAVTVGGGGAEAVSDEMAGHLYDNVYLVGHVARYARHGVAAT